MISALVRSGRRSGGLRSGLAATGRRLFRPTQGAATVWWREVLLVGVLYGAYEVSRGLGDIDVHSAVANGREILHLETLWHLDPEHLLNQSISHVEVLAVIASYFYSAMHYVVTPVVLVWMYRKHSEHYAFARTALAISTAIGLVGYLLLPTAPPRLLPHSGLHDILAQTQHWGWWGNDGSVPQGLGSVSNQFAAMPSLHVGWALWCGVLIARYAGRRWVRLLGVAYPIATTLVVIATGNHYLLDAVAGCVTMALGALLALGLPRRAVTMPHIAPHEFATDQPDNGPENAAPPAPAVRPSLARVRCSARSEPPMTHAPDAEYCQPRG